MEKRTRLAIPKISLSMLSGRASRASLAGSLALGAFHEVKYLGLLTAACVTADFLPCRVAAREIHAIESGDLACRLPRSVSIPLR